VEREGGGGSSFSRPGLLRRLAGGLARLSRRDGVGGAGARVVERGMSLGRRSSDSESEDEGSEVTRGEPTKGASRLY
jgi:hypothetical protein